MKSYVKIDRKVLFEICDAILNHKGGYTENDCYDDYSPYSCFPWDKKFRRKVENIRYNS